MCGSIFIVSRTKRRLFGESEQLAEILAALARSLARKYVYDAITLPSLVTLAGIANSENDRILRITTGSINTSRDFITDGSAW